MRDLKLILVGAMLVGAGVLAGLCLRGERAEAQGGAWHSCIVADSEIVNGNNPGEMRDASGERRVLVPVGYEPIGGGGAFGNSGDRRDGFVVLCRH